LWPARERRGNGDRARTPSITDDSGAPVSFLSDADRGRGILRSNSGALPLFEAGAESGSGCGVRDYFCDGNSNEREEVTTHRSAHTPSWTNCWTCARRSPALLPCRGRPLNCSPPPHQEPMHGGSSSSKARQRDTPWWGLLRRGGAAVHSEIPPPSRESTRTTTPPPSCPPSV